MTHFPDPAPGSHRRWAIFVVGAINFIMSMFYRVSLAVISPSLISDLRFDASQLSDLSAAFFYGFALCQLPLGLAIDRIGARKGLILLGAPAIAGGFVFAFGQSYEHLLLGRFLLGIGMGGNLMLVLALLAVWFPLDRFASLGSSLVAIGVVGNLFAATPLALMNGWLGWRSCFIIFTIVNALIIISFILIIRNYPPGYVKRAVKNRNLLQGFKTIARIVRILGYQPRKFCQVWVFRSDSRAVGDSIPDIRCGNESNCCGGHTPIPWVWIHDRFASFWVFE